MRLVTTTDDFAAYFSDKSVAAPLAAVKETGFRHIDLSMYCTIYKDSPWVSTDDRWKKEIEECAKIAEELDFDFCQAHSPGPGNCSDEAVNAIRNSIKACAMLGIPHTVVHAVVKQGATPEEFFKENLRFYKQFEDELEKYNVDLLIENSSSIWNPYYYLLSGEDMRRFIDTAKIHRMHICWDTGHGNAQGQNQYDDIVAMGSELRALHVQDNLGNADSHLMPLAGTTNFDRLLKGLIDIGYNGDFTFEAVNSIRKAVSWPHNRRDVREDDILADPPLYIKQKQQAVLFEIGKWMLESYDIKAE